MHISQFKTKKDIIKYVESIPHMNDISSDLYDIFLYYKEELSITATCNLYFGLYNGTFDHILCNVLDYNVNNEYLQIDARYIPSKNLYQPQIIKGKSVMSKVIDFFIEEKKDTYVEKEYKPVFKFMVLDSPTFDSWTGQIDFSKLSGNLSNMNVCLKKTLSRLSNRYNIRIIDTFYYTLGKGDERYDINRDIVYSTMLTAIFEVL